jgi:hypothetical protein
MIHHGVRLFAQVIAALMVALLTVGCGTAEKLPSSELPKYAVLYAKENGASAVTELDGKPIFALSGAALNVQPGVHRFVVRTCPEGTTAGCVPRNYELNLEAGRAYVIRSRSSIMVYDRFNMSGATLDTLHWNGTTFLNEAQVQAQREALQAAKNERLAEQAESRVRNLPRVRKVGARICQAGIDQYTRVGFVEGMTSEKVQIRVSDAFLTANPRMNNQDLRGIIWDNPLNWDLCE